MILDKLFPPKLKRLAFIPDTHVPFHDKRAFKLTVKALRDSFKPDILFVLGDFGEFYSVSFHEKDPNKATSLKKEVAAVKAALREVETIKAKEKHFIEGNHCRRVKRYLCEKAPALYGLADIPDLLELGSNWKFTPYKEHVQVGKLSVTHDLDQAGKNAIQGAHEQFHGNIVIGHVHRLGMYYGGNAQGHTHVSSCFGWLGDSKNSVFRYRHKAMVMKDWQLGFGIGFMEPNGNVHLQAVPIINYKCVVNGELISG